jgi:hypothetical protein
VQLNQMVAVMPAMTRPMLQQQLDELVGATAAEASAAKGLSPPVPGGGIDQLFSTVMVARARAVAQLRSTVDGLLGMAPLAVPGSPGGLPASGATGALLTTSQAATQLASVGAAMLEADHSYAAFQTACRHIAGNPSVPASAWVARPAAWSPGATTVLANLLGSSRTLAVVNALQLSAVNVEPAALPSPSSLGSGSGSNKSSGGTTPNPGPNGCASSTSALVGAPAVAVIPPTKKLSVTTVVCNAGDVSVRSVGVSVVLAQTGQVATLSRTTSLSLAAGGSQAVVMHGFAVVPGDTYTLTVTLVAPPGQSLGPIPSVTYTVRVSLAAPGIS